MPPPIDSAVTGPADAPVDVAIPIDAAVCPVDMTRVAPTSLVCIETAQRSNAAWPDARTTCTALGRRLCSDPEWLQACTVASGLVDMVGDYEWLAEESGGVAQKRGNGSCADLSAHDIATPYGYRCCAAL